MGRVPLAGDFDGRPVSALVFVFFLSARRCALPRVDSGRLRLTAGKLRAGEHPYDAALRIPLELAGFRMQRVHFFGREGDTLYGWVEGDRYRGK